MDTPVYSIACLLAGFQLVVQAIAMVTSTSSYVYEGVNVPMQLDEKYLQSLWESHLGSDMPPLKMLKRQIRCWPSGLGVNGIEMTATVTLVFLSSKPAFVRWFRMATKPKDTPYIDSDISNMMPVRSQSDGDSEYRISYITSGRVTANTLTIQHFNDHQQHVFETILTTSDGTIQYQLRTQVRQRCSFMLENIDGPEWVMIPPPRVDFKPKNALTIQCAGFAGRENGAFTNELIMSRAVPSNDSVRLAFYPVIHMHRDRGPLDEKDIDTVLIGRRRLTTAGHVIYHVSVSTHNATQSFEGVYQCIIVRQQDKLYVTSTVAIQGHRSPVPRIPQIEVTSCRQNDFNKMTSSRSIPEIILTHGVAACIRCRALADPPPDVTIYRGGDSNDVTELGHGSSGVIVSRFINVAEGGVAEVTYTLPPTRHQSPENDVLHSGYFHCTANNSAATQRLQFKLNLYVKTLSRNRERCSSQDDGIGVSAAIVARLKTSSTLSTRRTVVTQYVLRQLESTVYDYNAKQRAILCDVNGSRYRPSLVTAAAAAAW